MTGLRIGADIGGTWLRAAIARPGSATPRRLRRRLRPGQTPEQALRSLLRAAKRGGARVDSLTAGIRGFWRRSDQRRLKRRLLPFARRVRILSDMELAWYAALGGEPGVLVIAGTGSVAYGRDGHGRRARAGGLGHLFGDPGSAFWIGRTWLQGRPEAEALGYARRRDSLSAISALANRILRLAADGKRRRPGDGDPVAAARRITDAAAQELADLALRLSRKLRFRGRIPLSWHGGVFRNPRFAAQFLKRLDRRFQPHPPSLAAEVAAARLVQWSR
ncbi:MAG: hypothetical protein A2X36_05185 [Elusimicrobia bacterium GWA2_69_24]|nr:MAG: hypothetical protein A2X36_05185 [Elusimicrobia bacterium GWA2_69_24]HBL18757.1 hypothetical protein [Elusimicrobiota bacterium]